ncbi:MAG: hypothetical protein ACRERW_01345 [Pseudomonas sp.]
MLKLSDKRILAIFGRRNPSIFDAVIPHGPLSRFEEVALNPQPLPPRVLGAAIADELISSFRLAQRFGLDNGRLLAEIEELCPRRWKDLKFPPGWPRPPRPDPPPEWFIEFQLGLASRLAAASFDAEGTPLAENLNNVIELSLASVENVNA